MKKIKRGTESNAFLRSKKTPRTEELDSRSERTEWVQYSKAEVLPS